MSGHNGDPRVSRPDGDPSEMPVDLAAVQADDALLDLRGSVDRTSGGVDQALGGVDGELVRVLTAWRREVHADSIRELVDTDTALAAIGAARRPARPHRLVFAPVAAAAAVLVIAFSAVGLLAKSAHPGDNLWGVTQVLYSDYARSVEAAAFVQAELQEAKTALQQGRPERAKESLELIQQQLPAIAEAEGRTDLTARHHELERELGGGPPGQEPLPGSPDASPAQRPGAPESLTSSSAGIPPSEATSSSDVTTPTDADSPTDADPSTGPTSPTEPTSPTGPTVPDKPTSPDETNPRTGPYTPPAGANEMPRPRRPNQRPAQPPPPNVVPPEPPNSPPSPSAMDEPDAGDRGPAEPGGPPGGAG